MGTDRPFPITLALIAMTAAAAICVGGLYAWWSRGGDPASAEAALTSGLITWSVSVFAMLPVAVAGRFGLMPTVYAYFGGMFIRLPACLGLGVWFAARADLPTWPMTVTLALTYVVLLFVEVTFVGRYLWAKDSTSRTKSDSGDKLPPPAEPVLPGETPDANLPEAIPGVSDRDSEIPACQSP